MRKIHAILLAAGESRRMGFPKPLLMINDRTFVGHLSALMLAATGRVTVVLGAHASQIRPHVLLDDRIDVAENPDYKRGQLSSLKIGLSRFDSGEDAIMVHLTDHPLVNETTFCSIVRRYCAGKSPIVIARYRGKRGHPVIFDRAVINELKKASDEGGAKVVVDADAGRVDYVDVDDPGVTLDLDTPEALEAAGLGKPSLLGWNPWLK